MYIVEYVCVGDRDSDGWLLDVGICSTVEVAGTVVRALDLAEVMRPHVVYDLRTILHDAVMLLSGFAAW